MKIKIILIPILLMILSYTFTVNAVENPIDFATIDYRDFEYIIFESNQTVDLIFIDSELPSNALTVEFIEYFPSTNETKYKFTSNEITPNHWFTPGVKPFYYQDLNTGQVYIINVDYSDIIPPLSDTEIQYMNLQENYTDLYSAFNQLFSEFENQSDDWNYIIDVLSNYTNVSGNNLTNITKQLYDEYVLLKQDLNKSLQEIATITNELNNTDNQLKDIQDRFDILMINHSDLTEAYIIINESYNEANQSLIDTGTNLSIYMRFVEDIKGPSTSNVYFPLNKRYYHPFSYYQKKIYNMQGELNLIPSYIVLAVFITILISWLIARRIIKKTHQKYEEEPEISDQAIKYNKFLMKKKLPSCFKLRKKTKPTVQNETNPVNKTDLLENKLEKYQTETNKEIGKIHEKIDTTYTSIDQKIDMILQKNGKLIKK